MKYKLKFDEPELARILHAGLVRLCVIPFSASIDDYDIYYNDRTNKIDSVVFKIKDKDR